MSAAPAIEAGQEHRAAFPFIRTTYDAMPDDCMINAMPVEHPTWRPGVEHEQCNSGDTWSFAHGDGEVVYSVIAAFKPGKYPSRIFYLRNWIDPDGKRFGRNNLRISTTQHFRMLLKGYRHDYEIEEVEPA